MTHALAIDTTSDYLSLAVRRTGEPPVGHYAPAGTAITGALLEVLDGLLRRAGLNPRELGLVVAARGPGSFTGTRIGLAVAKTLAQLAGLPLVGVDTLHLLAAQARPVEGQLVHALLNCARDEVYHAPFLRRKGCLAPQAPIALTTFGLLPPLVGKTPVVLRCFAPPTPARAALLEHLARAPLAHQDPDGVLLLQEGAALFERRGEAPPPAADPIYIKTEAFRKWKP